MGRYRTAANREAYRRVIAEYVHHGGVLPAAQHTATVSEVIVAFVEFAHRYYRKHGKQTDEVRLIKTALRIVRDLYGRTPAAEFGPLALQAVRDVMIANGWCRNQINKHVDRVKRCFKWATQQQMVPGGAYEALRCVSGLKRGRSAAVESSKVKPVPDADVAATLEHLPAVVADMVQVQRLTGARPAPPFLNALNT